MVAWIIVAVLLVGLVFFSYQIYVASGNDVQPMKSQVVPRNDPMPTDDLAVASEPLPMPQELPSIPEPAAPLPMPVVVGQTEQELRDTRPVSETPPTVQYMEPEATDPLEGTVNSESEFGDNLRHPEQMIEMQPPLGSMRVPASGLGSEEGSVGGNLSVQYSSEMAQNGAEFMHGIFAFDGSDAGGIGYSMI